MFNQGIAVMNDNKLVSTVKKVLSEVISNDEILGLSESASLKEDVGLDSMTSLTFLMALEDKLEFTVDPSTLKASDFDSILSICAYIQSQKQQNVAVVSL
jgi:acyl carrier protein